MDAQREDAPRWGLWPSPSTPSLAVVGASFFASGFFLLAAAGNGYPLATLALILAGAVVLTVPIYVLAAIVTASEALVGRAWASGFVRLSANERGLRAASLRALRYAGLLWLANGCAMWFATLASRI